MSTNQNKHSSPPQWNSVPQPYPMNPANAHSQNGYNSPILPVHVPSSITSPHTTPSPYNNTHSQPQYSTYYNSSSNYPPSSSGHQQMYSSMAPNMPMNYTQSYHAQNIQRPQSAVPQMVYPSHEYSNPYSQSPVHSSHPPMGRPRSLSQIRAYGFPVLVEESEPHYTEIPIPQTIGISSEYPISSSRPFSCDLCALSFNRQHDLKRHRETHTGEKPYLCNGGCGKTFTRKDALKRHQLVKSCGHVEDTWS
ncbi:hypothetical protein BYT27DRAFT_7180553 [Phlegmacium glaucopus]|nr:hypothetical protein BYT27DRAFT_7180553 [Phlegmacium glaucopus]